MKILNLVTTPRPFFKQQTDILQQKGVELTTIEVPKRNAIADSRSIYDYIAYYPTVLKRSLDDFDVVHVNYGLLSPFGLIQPRRPLVLTLWGSDVKGRVGQISRHCVKLYDEVIVMSEEMEDQLGQEAHVIPHGIDLNKFKQMDQPEAKKTVGWSNKKKHVLFPYDPSRDVKNFDLAGNIVDRVQESSSIKVELKTVYGVDHDSVPIYMNAADALLLTSYSEGSPNAVKEAMACNLPVVSTNVGDVQELLGDVNQSRVCTSKNDLINTLHRILRQGHRSNGRQHIRHLSLDDMGDQIISVYEAALE
jgi:glycosyltransferase involved in cell wall biosynthesis